MCFRKESRAWNVKKAEPAKVKIDTPNKALAAHAVDPVSSPLSSAIVIGVPTNRWLITLLIFFIGVPSNRC